MRLLGVIPARGGSKRVPNKNILPLGGKPLIAWSIEVGLKTCEHLVVSTDDNEIAEVSRFLGAWTIVRPPELAADDMPMEPVIIHAAKNQGAALSGGYDAVLVLQPTSPFRSEEDVRIACRLFQHMRADSVISMSQFTDDEALFTMGHLSRLRPLRQHGATVYTPNGSIYLIETNHLLAGGDWYGPGAYGFQTRPERSIDINTRSDFDAAAAMLSGVG